jgi:hypothetical protein
MTKYVVPNNYKLHIAKQFIESVTEASNTAYYLFAAKHMPFTNTIPTPTDNFRGITHELYRDMMYGKRVANNDLRLMIRRIDWVGNTAYDSYDDIEGNLEDQDFYAVVNAGAFYHVWKCLDNNYGNTSTVEPNFGDIDARDEVYETSDKYRWKYMYSVSSTNVSKFGTNEYFPVEANSSVSENAVEGAIDIIKVTNAGRGYGNYLTGTFSSSDIRLNGNSLVFALGNTASTVNNYYHDCVLYLSSGTGVGQYRDIVGYVVNNTTKYVVVNTAFTTVPTNSTEYEIYPKVQIVGDGTESNSAVARAIVNTSGNTIERIEMMDRGAGYKYATANVLAHGSVGVSNTATLRILFGPMGGHGADSEKELFARRVCVSVKLSNTESNTIPAVNDINQFGLMKDVIFDNVAIETTASNGTFFGTEQVYRVAPVKLSGTISINTTSANVTGTDTDFVNQLSAGDRVYFKANTDHQLAQINSITNATHLILTSNGLFANTTAEFYIPNETSYGHVSSVSVGNVVVSNVHGVLENNNYLIGVTSGAFATINTISRNDITKGFDTFISMYGYRVQVDSGSLSPNEVVFQTDITLSNAYLHSAESLGSGIYKLYVTNQLGVFNVGDQLVGANSGAVSTILEKYAPEIRHNSGEILYLENIETVTRQSSQSETFKVIFEF